MFRWDYSRRVCRGMMWIKWILLITASLCTFGIRQPYRPVYENTTCLEIKKESRLSCNNKDQFYHCLLDENYIKEFEVCRDWKWIPGGKCAYLNSYGVGNIDERDCTSSSALQCATDQYRSDLNTQYNACYVKKRIAITTPIITVTVRRRDSGTSGVQYTSATIPPESAPPESRFDGSAVGLASGIIVSVILLAIVGIMLFKKRRHTRDTSKRETTVENGESETLVSTETKCTEENEQSRQQTEKDTSNRETLVENGECEVNSEIKCLEENEQTRRPKENEKDTSNKIKVTEGIFVDSLESITKENDEGGWSELQELLEYMCTGPARKILFNVVKMYVDNPDSYIQDESKKASVKTVLPTEYHSFLDHESEYRHSIPVCYTILQLSLSAEHQPKSSWDQKVKDADTGVGDDIKRVFRAYTLSRKIQNPEEISVDVYVRLFEMLIGAVERLDVKGKYSEDYREIVRRWENIQSKQWIRDKLKIFTNFITKWS